MLLVRSLRLPSCLSAGKSPCHLDIHFANTCTAHTTIRALKSANLLNNKIGGEQAQNLATILKEHASLKSLCGNKGDETVLDMSSKNLGADGAIMLAPEIVANRALTSINLLYNSIDKEGVEVITAAWEANKALKSICGCSSDLDVSSGKLDVKDLPVLCVELKHNTTLVTMNIKSNGIGDVLRKTALGRALQQSNVQFIICDEWSITQATIDLDVSGKGLDSADAVVLVSVLHNNRSLTSVNLSRNQLGAEGAKQLATAIKANVSTLIACLHPIRFIVIRTQEALTSLDISNNRIGYLSVPDGWETGKNSKEDYQIFKPPGGEWSKTPPPNAKSEGVIALGAAIKNNRALRKLDASDNEMFSKKDKAGITAWADALTANSSLTELNLAKNKLSGTDAAIIGLAISTNRALTSLNISNNRIGALVPPDGWETGFNNNGQQGFKPTGGEWTTTPPDGAKPEGVIALADAIKNNRALTTLNLAANDLGAKGAKHVAEAIKVNVSGLQFVGYPLSV